MKEKIVDIFMSVENKTNEVIANLCFMNVASKKVFLDEQTICYDRTVRGDYFKIYDESGKKVDYIGVLVSRDITPECFLILNPEQKLETSVNLSEIYKLEKGEKYTIQYSTYHPSYLNEQEFTKIGSNMVEIDYT
jgi:hypothetical protein